MTISAAAAVAFGAATWGATPAPTRADAVSLKQKVTRIATLGETSTRQLRRTTVTQNEINAYLAFDAGDQIPVGVVEPGITIVGDGRVSARAIVDLDAVRKQKVRSLLDPMNFARGRVAVTTTGVLRTSAGVGWVEFESGAIGSLPVPKLILQEIVSYYSRTPERPAGINLDDPFMLPVRIREIQVNAGQAIVIQ